MSNPNPFAAQINKPFPLLLVLFLKYLGGISTFVETGTYKGDTARLCANYFDYVWTIEAVQKRYEQLAMQEWPNNIVRWFGDSEDVLSTQLRWDTRRANGSPKILWLDAHWMHNGLPLEDDPLAEGISPCPLMAELKAVREDDMVLIDDARYFTAPPAGRSSVENWPTLDQIIHALPGRYVFICKDVIVAVPDRYRKPVQAWFYKDQQITKETTVYFHAEGLHVVPEGHRDAIKDEI